MPFLFSVVCQVCGKCRPSWIRVVYTVGLLLVGLYVVTGCEANNADIRSETTGEDVSETSARYETPSRYERAEPEACQDMGTGPTPAGAAPTGEYWFGFHFIDLQGETWVLLNGFPVDYVIGRSTDHTIGIKLNAALIGEGNQLTVRTIPALRREAQRLQVSPVQYCGRVVGSYNRPVSGGKMAAARVDSAYAAWQEALNPVWTSVLQAEAASELGSASAIDAMRDSVAAQPFELAATFDNERGPDFSYLFEEAPVIDGTAADRARLRDYAVDLVNMFVQKDTNAVYNEVSIELRDADFTPTQARQLVASDWLSFSWRKISKEDVGLRAWSGGRVWELYRKPSGDPLLVAGREYQNGLLEVYVAQIDGELKVVR